MDPQRHMEVAARHVSRSGISRVLERHMFTFAFGHGPEWPDNFADGQHLSHRSRQLQLPRTTTGPNGHSVTRTGSVTRN